MTKANPSGVLSTSMTDRIDLEVRILVGQSGDSAEILETPVPDRGGWYHPVFAG